MNEPFLTFQFSVQLTQVALQFVWPLNNMNGEVAWCLVGCGLFGCEGRREEGGTRTPLVHDETSPTSGEFDSDKRWIHGWVCVRDKETIVRQQHDF